MHKSIATDFRQALAEIRIKALRTLQSAGPRDFQKEVLCNQEILSALSYFLALNVHLSLEINLAAIINRDFFAVDYPNFDLVDMNDLKSKYNILSEGDRYQEQVTSRARELWVSFIAPFRSNEAESATTIGGDDFAPGYMTLQNVDPNDLIYTYASLAFKRLEFNSSQEDRAERQRFLNEEITNRLSYEILYGISTHLASNYKESHVEKPRELLTGLVIGARNFLFPAESEKRFTFEFGSGHFTSNDFLDEVRGEVHRLIILESGSEAGSEGKSGGFSESY